MRHATASLSPFLHLFVAASTTTLVACGEEVRIDGSTGGAGGTGDTASAGEGPQQTSSTTSVAGPGSGSGGDGGDGSGASGSSVANGSTGSGADGGGGSGGVTGASSSSGGFACADPPASETCATPEDDDCDGTECAIWARSYAGFFRETVLSSAGTEEGDLYLLGDLVEDLGSIVFGGETVSADATHTMFLAKLSASGEELWIRLLPADRVIVPYQIVTTSAGGVVLTRWLDETADFGGGPITPVGDLDVVFVGYGPDGDHQWQKVLTPASGGSARVWSYGREPAGDIVYFGDATPNTTYEGSLVIGDSSGRSQSVFSLKIDPDDGALRWSHELPIGEADQADLGVSHPTFDAQGNIAIAGAYTGDSVDFGLGPLPYDGDPFEGYVARFDADGEVLASTRVCEGNCYVHAATSTPAGELYLSAVAREPSTLGGEVEVDFIQAFMLKLTPDDDLVWSIAYSTPTPSDGLWLANFALEANGDVTFVIPYQDELDFEPETVEPATFVAKGDYDLLVGKLHPDGAMRWVRTFGSPGSYVETAYDTALTVRSDGHANVAFTYVSHSGIDFGSGPLVSSEMTDMAVVHLAP